MNMLKKCAVVTLAFAGLGWGASSVADLKIGVVEYRTLMDESPQTRTALQTLQNEFAARQREIVNQQNEIKVRQDRFERESALMSEVKRGKTERSLRGSIRELSRKQDEITDDFSIRRNEEINRLQKMLEREVQALAKAQGYDLVIADGFLYAKPEINFTPIILNILRAKAKPASAPAGSQNR